ncbi:MAG: Lrp/AsnC ligand binding domain-containing protein [Candidatus Ranarchaeia archaeon]
MTDKIIGFVLIHVSAGTEHQIIEQLKQLDDIPEAYVTFGSWDIIVRIETTKIGKLESIIGEIRKIPEVLQTSTLLAA